MNPPVSIVGQPRVSAGPNFRDRGTWSNAVVRFASFSFETFVRIERPAQGALSDWEVGIVQMVSGPIDTRCYLNRGTGRVFVDRLDLPRQQFYPDRDPVMGLFYSRESMRDLAYYSPNETVAVNATDDPGLNAVTVAPQMWTSDTSFNALDPETWFILTRSLHKGFFYTYLTARHKPTGELLPLYYAYWWLGVQIRFQWHGQGIPLTPTVERYNICRLIEDRPYRNSDFTPVVSGQPMNFLGHRLAGHRRRYWNARLLEFADHI